MPVTTNMSPVRVMVPNRPKYAESMSKPMNVTPRLTRNRERSCRPVWICRRQKTNRAMTATALTGSRACRPSQYRWWGAKNVAHNKPATTASEPAQVKRHCRTNPGR